MSDPTHTIPGQSLLERLFARGAVRPAVGVSSAFFERFGLTDPWLDSEQWSFLDDDADGVFYFLSAAPYYARLRAERARASRSRRRLLERLSLSSPLVGRSFERLSLQGPSTGAWLKPSFMASHATSAMVMIAPPEPEVVESSESEGRRGFTPSTRPVRTPGVMTSFAAEPEVRRRRVSSGAVPAVLEELLVSARGSARRVLRRVIEQVQELPAEEQIVVARHVARQVGGPAGRYARAAVAEASEEASHRAVSVAASRLEPTVGSKGLRPVLSRSPSLTTLAFESSPEVELAEERPVPRRRSAAVVPATPVRRASAHREAPEARVVREARTQRETGRAGPTSEVGRAERAPASAAVVASPVRRPTEWLASLAAGSERIARREEPSYGLAAVGRGRVRRVSRAVVAEPAELVIEELVGGPEPARRLVGGLRRLTERQVESVARGSLGERLVSPAPTRGLRARRSVSDTSAPVVRVRERSGSRASSVPSQLWTVSVEAPEVGALPRVVRRLIERTEQEQELTAPAERAVERLSAESVVRRSRAVAALPTSYVRPQGIEESSEETASASPARRRALASESPRPTRPTFRAATRDAVVPRRDGRGRSLLSVAPTAHVQGRKVRRLAAAVSLSSPEVRVVEAPELQAPVGPARRRLAPRVAERAESSAVERAEVAPSAVVRAARRAEAPVEAPVAPVAREQRVARKFEPTAPMYRAAERAEESPSQVVRSLRRLAPAPMAYVQPEPLAEVVAQAAAPVRRARSSVVASLRSEAGKPVGRRVALSPAPTDYLSTPRRAVQAASRPATLSRRPRVESEAESAPVRRSRPSVRAASRAVVAPRVDSRGSALLTSGPTDYLSVAQSSEAVSTPVVRRSRRASAVSEPVWAPEAEPVVAAAEPAAVRIARRAQAPAVSRVVSAEVGEARTPEARPAVRAAERLSPESRVVPGVRRMRTAGVSTDAVVQPVDVEVEPVEPERRASSPTARVAERLTASSRPAAASRAVEREVVPASRPRRRPVVTSVGRAERSVPVEEVLVRDASGRVVRARRVSTGAAVYASSRLLAAESPEVAPRAPGVRRSRTALERSVSQHAIRPVAAHAVASTDFRWVTPLSSEPEVTAPPSTWRRPVLSRSEPVVSQRLARVLREVTSAVRAVQRADDARVLTPSTRRTLSTARAVVAELVSQPERAVAEAVAGEPVVRERRVRRARTVELGTLLRVIDTLVEPATSSGPVAWAERRSAVPSEAPVARGTRRPMASSTVRRAFAGGHEAEALPVEHAVSRAVRRERPLRSGAQTVRTADGRFTPSMSRLSSASRLSGVYGLGEPGLPEVGRRAPRVHPVTGVVLSPVWSEEVEVEPAVASGPARRARGVVAEPARRVVRRARPLTRTLELLGTPETAAAAAPVVAERRTRRSRLTTTEGTVVRAPAVEPVASEEPTAPSWARRARPSAPGRGLSRVERRSEELPVHIGGGILTALARAGTPEDVVKVILERSDSMRQVAKALPSPAVRLVERIVEIQRESQAPSASVVDDSVLLRPSGGSSSGGRGMSSLSGVTRPARSAQGVGASQVMKLAKKLQNLIHLAEADRRLAEAQRQVRMAEDSAAARAEAGHGADEKSPTTEAPNIQALQRDVLEAVLAELDMIKQRRQEDFNHVWW